MIQVARYATVKAVLPFLSMDPPCYFSRFLILLVPEDEDFLQELKKKTFNRRNLLYL